MIEFKINGKFKVIILSALICINSKAKAEDIKDHFVIRGEVDLKTSEFITKKIQELKEKNDKLQSDILLLQDKLISKSKDKIDLNIYLSLDNQLDVPNYGIVQLSGSMNHIPLIQYDHPLIFQKDEKLPLFEGAVPLGEYEFKMNAIVGQQLEKWPFVLPEGKWSIEKTIKIEAHTAGDKKNLQIALRSDKATGVPQFEMVEKDKK